MRKLFYLFPILLILSCGGPGSDPLKSLRPAEGGVNYGGTLRYNEVENIKGLYPPSAAGIIESYHIINQLYEGLVRLNIRSLNVEPGLAERWEIDSTGTIYSFKLRKGVFFHDDPCFENGKGRELKASDVKNSFDRLCKPDALNKGFWIFQSRVKGAQEYFNASMSGDIPSGGVEGFKVTGDYSFQIVLNKPFASFINILAMPYAVVIPHEAEEKYKEDLRKHAVGTGPFKLKEYKENEVVILLRNENYWGKDSHGNQLPYLDAIQVGFVKEKKSELLEFKKGNLDMVYKLPLDMVEEVVDNNGELKGEYVEFNLQKVPALSIEYYGFKHTGDIFNDVLVRQAFNYAIDRRQIVDFTLKGTAIPAVYGVVPPALIGYDTKAVKGYDFNPDKGKQLLAEAGYENGIGFPEVKLIISRGGGSNEQIAEAIQKMLKDNLNVNVQIESIPLPQLMDKRESGKAEFWRRGWIADYADPENFLNLFHSKHIPADSTQKSYMNNERYSNSTFDSLMNKAFGTMDDEERNMLYLQADQKLMDDAVVLPLYYEKIYRLLKPHVQGFYQNPLEYRDFREVYFGIKEEQNPS